MRITNKIMQNNSLQNINTNKLLQDKLSTQMATEKKVNRPSDDPVVAIRALRLRTNVSQITQYYEKNVPDAEQWLSLTAEAISTVSDVITDLIANATTGSSEDLDLEDREAILTALEELRDEVYATGNTDYAGRYIFTGYRTDSSLTFTGDTQTTYTITEQVDSGALDEITYVDITTAVSDGDGTTTYVDLTEINEANFAEEPYSLVEETQITISTVHRLRLSYDAVDGETPSIQVWDEDSGRFVDITELYTDYSYSTASLYDDPSPYSAVGENDIILVEETGELLLGDNVYATLMALQDDPSTNSVDEGEIRVTYQKTDWEEGDLKPEHYFACEADGIEYNSSYLEDITQEKQAIEYDVGLNQTIQVNTTADEIFVHAIGRDIDDMIAAMEETIAIEEVKTKLETMIEEGNYDSDEELAILEQQLAAAEKALTYSQEKTQELYEGCITKMQEHLDTVNLATTENGTRSQRLELIENRLMNQKTNYETLQSENEDADVTEVAIQLTSAQLTYDAALAAVGKILENSLMNYI